jgi:hypothetical protein
MIRDSLGLEWNELLADRNADLFMGQAERQSWLGPTDRRSEAEKERQDRPLAILAQPIGHLLH